MIVVGDSVGSEEVIDSDAGFEEGSSSSIREIDGDRVGKEVGIAEDGFLIGVGVGIDEGSLVRIIDGRAVGATEDGFAVGSVVQVEEGGEDGIDEGSLV